MILSDAQTNFASTAVIENFGQEVQVTAENLKVTYTPDSTSAQKTISIEPTADLSANINNGKVWCWTTTENFEFFFSFAKKTGDSFGDLCTNPSRLDDYELVRLLCEQQEKSLPWYMVKDNSNFRGISYAEQPIDASVLPTSISSTSCSSADAYCPGDQILKKLGDDSIAKVNFIQSFLGNCQFSPLPLKKLIIKKACQQISSNAAEITGLAGTNVCATKKCTNTVSLNVQNAAGETVDLASPSGSYVQTMELKIETTAGASGYTINAATLIIDYTNETPKASVISLLEGSLTANAALQTSILPGNELKITPSLDFTSCADSSYSIKFGEDHIMSCSLSVAIDGTCENDALAIKNQVALEFGKSATTTILFEEGTPNFEYSILGAQNEYFYYPNSTTFAADTTYDIEHRVIFIQYTRQPSDIFTSVMGTCEDSEVCLRDAPIATICFAVVFIIFLLWIYATRDEESHRKVKVH
ncbi:Oidioi.mRNA.OKI2018_I69.chr1.g3842.t1.cds [Oikopleura dioica]|uniref:Oidioi.mRNA.OKI2018_I69.chr1.g3842.t1.cds n=1 Tax=Oikopleura dioica TaxID=34765 RepID=A0ABN7T0X6_OIKDI|nr:Oidioi.mRNA.OKI2018_I69.chr1.g3842.t1.cds [Oikopleura dioica]